MLNIYERSLTVGAIYLGEGRCRFRVWAPNAERVDIHLLASQERMEPLEARRRGYFQAVVEGVESGSAYLYRLNGKLERPDPASRHQPHGVAGPSRVIDPDFDWNDRNWFGVPLQDYIIYELHVGTFTPEGTFGAAISHISRLKDLGVTAVEVMPVGQFAGERNWGYDGVFPFAVQNSYGGPVGLKRFVDACHVQGLAVILDVVYSRPGWEGNCLGDYGPYYNTDRLTPWGPAVNFDGAHSDEVRRFFIENALYWVLECHVDGLRLHSLDTLYDFSARSFLEELGQEVHDTGDRINHRVYLFGESKRNDVRLIKPREMGGYGLNSCWNDDFHHALHSLLTGEQTGYYRDYGRLRNLSRAYTEGFSYTGQHSQYYRRKHGSFSGVLPAKRFVVFAQNHEQVGMRLGGERLGKLVSADSLRLAAGTVILSPFIPMLFMGEEYGETAPFHHFTGFTDEEAVQIRRGQLKEWYAQFQWEGTPVDPQSEAAFTSSRLAPNLYREEEHAQLLAFYRELIRLRKGIPALYVPGKLNLEVNGWEREKVLFVRRWCEGSDVFLAFNFSDEEFTILLPVPVGMWHLRLDSSAEIWGGSGFKLPETVHSGGEAALKLARRAFVLYEMEERG
jgi:maltooligosyltrehalose trehalohydrolase